MIVYENILYDLSDGIATITLNRPDKLNAYTTEMGNEVVDAFSKIRGDAAARVVILTGAGRAFCAGVDLDHLKAHQAYADDGVPGPYLVTIVNPPDHGTLTEQSLGVYLYSPDSGYTGSDFFRWSVNDGMTNSNWGRVDVSINEVPVASDQSFTTLQDHALSNWLDYSDDDFPGRFSDPRLMYRQSAPVHAYSPSQTGCRRHKLKM